MQTHLITGVAGFIPTQLALKLLIKGDKVIGVDNFLLGKKENINRLMEFGSNFKFLELDLSKKNSVKKFLKKFKNETIDLTWHLAANSDIKGFINGYELDFNNTFKTTLYTTEIMKMINCYEIVFASSSAIFGNYENPISEISGPLLPISYYGAMKLASEAFISALQSYQLKRYTIARFPNVIGPNPTHGVIHDFVKKLEENPNVLNVLGNGSQKKPYLHVDDIVNGLQFIQKNKSDKRLFNLSPLDDGVTVKEIAEMCVNLISPKAKIKFEESNIGWIGDVTKYRYDTTKQRKIGWSPKYSSKEAVRVVLKQIISQK